MEWAGIAAGSPGLAGQPEEFQDLCLEASEEIGQSPQQTIQDYWLAAVVHSIATEPTSREIYHGTQPELVAHTAFAGGTSLVMAWNLCERHSEDVDLIALTTKAKLSGHAFERILSKAVHPVLPALGTAADAPRTFVNRGEGYRNMDIPLAGSQREVAIDVTIEAPSKGLPLAAPRTVRSVMGYFASDEQLAAYPELGGFEMLCITPACTARNKLDALHRRATLGFYRDLVKRARDLYDLYRVALSAHEPLVRELIEASSGRIARPFSDRADVPRPGGGFGMSSAFTPGTEAYAALEVGFQQAVDNLVWGEAPTFKEAIEAARSLDLD